MHSLSMSTSSCAGTFFIRRVKRGNVVGPGPHRVNAGRECEGGKGQRHTVVPSSSKPEVYPFEARISNDVYPRRAAKRGRSPAA